MANKTISDFTQLTVAQDNDLILISSNSTTYTVPVSVFKEAAKQALAEEITNVINQIQSGATVEITTNSVWGQIVGSLDSQADLVAALRAKADAGTIPTKVTDLDNNANYISNGTSNTVSFYGNTNFEGQNDSFFGEADFYGAVTVAENEFIQVIQTEAYNPGTVAPNATFSKTDIDVAIDGWTAIGVVGWRCNVQDILIRTMRINAEGYLEIEGKNVGTSSRNPGIYARILYLRTNEGIEPVE